MNNTSNGQPVKIASNVGALVYGTWKGGIKWVGVVGPSGKVIGKREVR